MNKRRLIRILIWTLMVGTCQPLLSPQVANAGAVNFLTGGTVTVPYDPKFDVGTGAFTLEMWVKETAVRPAQYTAQFFRGTKLFNWNDRVNKSSWGMGVTFDSENLYLAPEVGKWPTPAVLKAGTDNGYADSQSSNTKTAKQVYQTFEDQGWHHLAVSKTGVGGALSTYLDGVRVIYSPNDSNTFMMYEGDILIGGGKFVGEIGDVRLVKGQALYSGPSITVPTSQITTTSQGAVASNVSLLLKAGGSNCAISDFSDNHFDVLRNGVSCNNQSSRAITSFNLQFNNQGHGTKPADVGNINQIATGSLPAIANDGFFTFLGWADAPSGALLTGTYTATADSTLYALWRDDTPVPPVATFHLNGGTSTTPAAQTLSVGASFTLPSAPTWANHFFNGWNTIQAGSGDQFDAGASVTIGNTAKDFYAQWLSTSHPITRSASGNWIPDSKFWTYQPNAPQTLGDVSVGWCVVGGTNSIASSWVAQRIDRDSFGVTVYIDPSLQFAGGAYSFSPDPSITISGGAAQSVQAGNPIQNTTLTNTGCASNKFSISPSLPSGVNLDTTTGVISGTPTAPHISTTYELRSERWVNTSTGALDLSGSMIGYSVTNFSLTTTAAPRTISIDTSTVSSTYSSVEMDSFQSLHAHTSSGGGAITFATSTPAVCSVGSVDGIAHYISAGLCSVTASVAADGAYADATSTPLTFIQTGSTFTVTFDYLGGTGGIASQTYTYLGSPIVLPATSRAGYTFNGWFNSQIAGTLIGMNGETTTASADTTLFGRWSANTYRVTYSAGLGTVATAFDDYLVNGAPLQLPAAVRRNYNFDGWYTSSNGGNLLGSSSDTLTVLSDTTIYAHWTQLSLVGLTNPTSLGTITTASGIDGGISASRLGTRVDVSYFADSLPDNTVITAFLQGSTTHASALLTGVQNLLLSVVVAWKASDESVPAVNSQKDSIRLRITNSDIKSGAKVYSILGNTTRIISTATSNGFVEVELREDPEIVIANPVVIPPAPPLPVQIDNSLALKIARDQEEAALKAAADLLAAQEKATAALKAAQERAAADLLAAQERAAADLTIEREKAAADLKAAQDAASRLKAEKDAKYAAEVKAAEDAAIAAALAQQKIIPDITLYSISATLKLSAFDSYYLKKYVAALKSKSTVTCIGYIYSNNIAYSVARSRAQKQASAVCTLIKHAKKSLITKVVLYAASKAPVSAKGAKWVAVSYRVDGFKS